VQNFENKISEFPITLLHCLHVYDCLSAYYDDDAILIAPRVSRLLVDVVVEVVPYTSVANNVSGWQEDVANSTSSSED
jgi:hypothetical protein